MATPIKKLENNIKPLREARGWSQEVLAAKMDTTGPQINRLENGQRKLTVGWLLRLCAAFDMPADKIANIPVSKIDKKNLDHTMLGLVIGWLIEACDKYKIDQNPRDIGKWATYVYTEVDEQDLNFDDAKELAFKMVQIGKQKRA